METTFTPIAGIIGGALIGLASATLLLASGRIAGISGILGRSFFDAGEDRPWQLAFLFALPIGAWAASSSGVNPHGFAMSSSPALLVAGGLFVGVGTQLGNGCTSGHGVCGMARGSRRSIVATLTFMASAAATVYVMRHGLGA